MGDGSSFDKNLTLEEIGDQARACYRILAFSRAQPILLEKLSESSFDDMVFLGGFYRDWCNWEKSRQYYTLALKLAESHSNDEEKMIALNNLGLVFYLEGDTESGRRRCELFAESRSMYLKALDIGKQIPRSPVNATTQRNYQYLVSQEDALLSAPGVPAAPPVTRSLLR